MQLRPFTMIIVACVAALFGFAGAASRTCVSDTAMSHAEVPGAELRWQ